MRTKEHCNLFKNGGGGSGGPGGRHILGHILYINPNINQTGGMMFPINSATMANLLKETRSHGNVLLILDRGFSITSYNTLQMKR